MSNLEIKEGEYLPPDITISVISDPFRFITGDSTCVITKKVPYIAEGTLAEYVHPCFADLNYNYEYALSVNGKVVPEYERPFVKPLPGDFLAFCPMMEGGGGKGGKNPLAMVAMLAVMIVAPEFGVWAVGLDSVEGAAIAMGMSYGVATSVAGGLFSLAMGAVVSAVFSSSAPNTEGTSGYDMSTDSPTYGWDVRGNPSDQNRPVPVLYGTMRIQPPIIGKYISIDGNKQYLNVLMLISEGEIDSITGMEINNNNIGTYQEVTWEIRLGTNRQSLIPNFSDTYYDTSVDVRLGTSYFVAATSGNALTSFGVGITFRNGLYYANNSGGLDPRIVVVEIQYQKAGAVDWIDVPGSPFTITQDPATKSAIRNYYLVENLEAGAYNIRARRTTETSTELRVSDACVFDYIQEIIPDDFIYPNRALWAVRALATDQLSGGMPTFNCVASRGYVDVWNPVTIQWERKSCQKPCWAAYDILHNSRYGGDVLPERILFQDFAKWEGWNVTKGLTCNIYFDSQMSIPEALNHIGLSGRAAVVPKQYYYGVIIDMPTNPVGMYSVGNILKSTFEIAYMDLKDRANVLEITYFDKDKDYSRQTFEINAEDFVELESEIIKASYTLYAVTNRQEAVNYARFMLNCNKHLQKIVSFKADIDTIAHQSGDVVWVQHYVPYWGEGGRIVEATMHSVTLPFNVTIDAGNFNIDTDYYVGDVVLWMGAMYRCLVNAEAPAPWPTDLQWWSPSVYGLIIRHYPEALAWDGTTTYEDMDYVEHGLYLYVSTQNNNVGHDPEESPDYWVVACDMFEEKVITNTPGTYNVLSVETMFKKLPVRGDLFSFGVIGKEAKLFRILTIAKDQNVQASITALEYRKEVYERDQLLPAYPEETSLVAVTNLRVQEAWLVINGLGAAMVELTWLGYISNWKVFQRILPSGPWMELAITSNSRYDIYNLSPGVTYEFAVTAFGSSNPDSGQKDILTFIGHPPEPNLVQDLLVSTGHLGFILDWTLDPTPWVLGYDISDALQVLESGYSGNNYLIKQNMQTGLYTFKVRGRDAFGQTGAWVSVTHSINGPAQVIGIAAVNIDEVVMLYWTPPAAGSLPIVGYEVRRGTIWASAVSVGSLSSPYAQISELQGGDKTYWIAGVDSGGNYGIPGSLTVHVDGPSGYILHTLENSDFHTGQSTNLCMKGPEGVAVANFTEFQHHLFLEAPPVLYPLLEDGGHVFLESGSLLIGEGLFVISDSLEDGEFLLEDGSKFYFDGGDSWDAGPNPNIPSVGTYEEEFDIGTVITNSKISLSISSTNYESGIVILPFISVKTLFTDSWSSETPGTVDMRAQFRYVKIRFEFLSDTVGYSFLEGFSFRVEAKEITDHGVGEVLVGQPYVDVPLNKTFVSVKNVIATPMGTTAKFCVAADPSTNPAFIRVYIFDGITGAPTDGTFSWSCDGYQ